jgi:hypothetical protein
MGSSLTGNPPSEARTLTRPPCLHGRTEDAGRMAPDLMARAIFTLPETGLSRGRTLMTGRIPKAIPADASPSGFPNVVSTTAMRVTGRTRRERTRAVRLLMKGYTRSGLVQDRLAFPDWEAKRQTTRVRRPEVEQDRLLEAMYAGLAMERFKAEQAGIARDRVDAKANLQASLTDFR